MTQEERSEKSRQQILDTALKHFSHKVSGATSVPDISDHGYQLQASAMVVPKALQLYFGTSQIFGNYGDPWEVRGGASWYPMKERGIRVNGEWMYVDGSPVGYTAYPYAVGSRGPVFHLNLEMNF